MPTRPAPALMWVGGMVSWWIRRMRSQVVVAEG
jgi:hypothetical protein